MQTAASVLDCDQKTPAHSDAPRASRSNSRSVATSQPDKTQGALAERKFEVGQMVYTKIVGYPPWPSCIVELTVRDNVQVAVVRYFGWNSDRSYAPLNKLTPLAAEQPILKKFYSKQKMFTKAVDQMKKIIQNIENDTK